jgi:hypothetical protein
VKTYAVTSNAAIKSYTVTIGNTPPPGTKITAVDGVTEKTTFNAGEEFKVLVPKSSITANGNIKLEITGELANNVVMYGGSNNAATQDYVLTGMPFIPRDVVGYADYYAEDTTTQVTTTPTTTAPTTEHTTMRGIQCYILAPLKGHEFKRACSRIGGEYKDFAGVERLHQRDGDTPHNIA